MTEWIEKKLNQEFQVHREGIKLKYIYMDIYIVISNLNVFLNLRLKNVLSKDKEMFEGQLRL